MLGSLRLVPTRALVKRVKLAPRPTRVTMEAHPGSTSRPGFVWEVSLLSDTFAGLDAVVRRSESSFENQFNRSIALTTS